MKTAPEKPIPIEPQLVQCEVCLTEIPETVAQTAEGPDYIHHFCGIDCMSRWKQRKAAGVEGGD